MRKLHILILTIALTSAVTLRADQVVEVTLNTASINGLTGSLDFAFDPGALSSQAASVTVFNLAGVTSAGVQILTGAASGGPISAPITISNNSAFQSNDDFETVTFGKSLSFTLDFGGPAINSPTGSALSTTQFAFYTYSDANGTIPVLTSDPSGLAGLITVNLNGTLSSSAVSPNLAFSSVPEPATVWLAGSVVGVFGLHRLRRRSA